MAYSEASLNKGHSHSISQVNDLSNKWLIKQMIYQTNDFKQMTSNKWPSTKVIYHNLQFVGTAFYLNKKRALTEVSALIILSL